MKDRKLLINARNGFSLIEVLFAASILGLGIITVMGFISTAYDGISQTSNSTAVVLTTQCVLDRILSENNFLAPGKRNVPTEQFPSTLIDSSGRPTAEIEYWPEPSSNPKSQIVCVEARWKQDGRIRTYKLTGLIVP
jgi:prepilin-type N-terminal cleavage/methylation domain-containing protein